MITRKGMTLVLVLALCFGLLTMAIAYIRVNKQSRPINTRLSESIQADFIGQGVVNLAVLKFKKRPAEFYYAYKAFNAGINGEPFRVYTASDTTINGVFTDPSGVMFSYFTEYELVANRPFEEDAIIIRVRVEQRDAGGNLVLTRNYNHTIHARRGVSS